MHLKAAIRDFVVLCAAQGIFLAHGQSGTSSNAGSTVASAVAGATAAATGAAAVTGAAGGGGGSCSISATTTKTDITDGCTETLAKDKSCKLPNDFEKSICGESGTTNQICCGSRQACVTVKFKVDAGELEAVTCSADRHLSGSKNIKIVIIPMLFLIMDVAFIAFMAMRLNVGTNHTTKACIGIIAVSWPLLLSQSWFYAVWAGFLAVFVAFLANTRGFPYWIYRLAWGMQVFQLVLLFGPNEAFHVPIFNQSLAGSNSRLATMGMTEAGCNAHFENYFAYLPEEMSTYALGADPDAKNYGLCSYEWLSLLWGLLLVQGIVVMATVLVSAPFFLDVGGDGLAGLIPQAVKTAVTPVAKKVEPAPVADPESATAVTPVTPFDDKEK